jgi:hypothetical protein
VYGEPDQIRRLATRMRERATDLEIRADQLVGAAQDTHWWSTAGGSMRAHAGDLGAEIRATARAYGVAADKIDAHAQEVEERLALIAAIEERVTSMIAGAVDRLRDFADSVVDGAKDMVGLGDGPDPQDERLASYAPPPPGDRAWLDVPDDLGVRI